MENLNNELLENYLLAAECVYSESKKGQYRFTLWAGEELSMSSLRKNFAAVGLLPVEKELKSLVRKQLCELVLDDGWLHVSLMQEMFNESQKQLVENSYEFEVL